MTNQEVTQEQFERLIEDAAYLQDEAEALKYVIDEAPYTQVPTGGMSILQKLALIDYAQTEYYRPIIENVFSSNRLVNLDKYKDYKEAFTPPDEAESDVQKILNKIVKHRAGLLNTIRNIPLIDWEKLLLDKEGNKITLFTFATSMITNERRELKEIADLILIYQNSKRSQKEAESKAMNRNKIEE